MKWSHDYKRDVSHPNEMSAIPEKVSQTLNPHTTTTNETKNLNLHVPPLRRQM